MVLLESVGIKKTWFRSRQERRGRDRELCVGSMTITRYLVLWNEATISPLLTWQWHKTSFLATNFGKRSSATPTGSTRWFARVRRDGTARGKLGLDSQLKFRKAIFLDKVKAIFGMYAFF
jgi:hypothetical protein